MVDAASRSDARSRIIAVAARLLRELGPSGVTTRSVAAAAGVQPPALYRLFGDKDGLLEAVAEHVMASYVAAKADRQAALAEVDALDDLREGWRAQIEFAVSNPALFRLFSDPERVQASEAARAGRSVLAGRVHRVALTGRLRVSERRAVDLVQAAGVGTVQTLLATPPEHRDPALADSMYEAVLQQIVVDPPSAGPSTATTAAVALRARAEELEVLTPAERLLLVEWLDRVVERG